MSYGVNSGGFKRKPILTIADENKLAAKTIFGDALIDDDESPMGQLIGLFSLLSAKLWEQAEDTYHSFDPDQSEGVRLDMLGKIRAVDRPTGRTDAGYRGMITNAGKSDIHLRPLINDVTAVDGVEWVKVWANDGDEVDNNGIPGHSLCVVVIGGADETVASAIFDRTVTGIGLYGNTPIEINDAGYCRTVGFLRPAQVGILVEIDVNAKPIAGGCVTPDLAAISAQLESELGLASEFGLTNGESVDPTRIIGAVSKLAGLGVQRVRMTRAKDAGSGTFAAPIEEPVEIDFDEIAILEEVRVYYLPAGGQ